MELWINCTNTHVESTRATRVAIYQSIHVHLNTHSWCGSIPASQQEKNIHVTLKLQYNILGWISHLKHGLIKLCLNYVFVWISHSNHKRPFMPIVLPFKN